MKIIFKTAIFLTVAFSCLTSCFVEPSGQGYLSDAIYLKGQDTMYVVIGSKTATDVAWLDNSTQPCTFSIVDVRDENGNRKNDFFTEYPTKLWISPYDYLTDTTIESVLSKLSDAMITPLMINEVNGQLRAMESTSNMDVNPGEIYNVDVSVTNSRGTKVLKDYAVIKFEEGEAFRPFILNEVINGICITNSKGENTFPYYDRLNSGGSNFAVRRDNVYADNGKEFVTIHKISNEPTVGIKVHFKLIDKNGKLFDPSLYATYSTLTSYINYGLNRINSPQDGMVLEFPVVPWPVKTDLMSYWSGPSYATFDNLDTERLKADNKAGKIPFNASWPADDYAGAKGWFVRIRSVVTFYESGTWEFICKVPYTTAK
ncbi:MAG: DUF5007 domain-containing protein [Bacteroidales bacterium]|jgi:hypothetical protein|nr:DUF5007 domain-containing protein [Bacteroidales bacterium]